MNYWQRAALAAIILFQPLMIYALEHDYDVLGYVLLAVVCISAIGFTQKGRDE